MAVEVKIPIPDQITQEGDTVGVGKVFAYIAGCRPPWHDWHCADDDYHVVLRLQNH
jgi:hypothetical protein